MRTTVVISTDKKQEKEILRFTPKEFVAPLLFLLSLSLLGLEMPLAYLFILISLLYNFYSDKYNFLLQVTILFGVYGFYDDNLSFPFKLMDISLIICFITTFIYQKDKILKWLIYGTILYAAFLIYMATRSDEVMSIQFRRLREYLFIIYFLFPLLIFVHKEFDIKQFFRTLFIYMLIISSFNIIDSLILNSHLFLPRTLGGTMTISSIEINLFSGYFPRKYPLPILMLSLCIFPILYFYKLTAKQWIIILLSVIITRTFSIIGGLFITYFLFAGKWSQKLKYVIIFIIFAIFSYFIDGLIDGKLRIRQFADQFTALATAVDIEDMADFASGRGAQVIPKINLLISMDKQYTGFGFLHNELTTNPKYLIMNDLYTDITKSEEVAALVEVTQIQTILDVGIIGFLIQNLFFFGIYIVIRKLRYSKLYLSTLICISLFGVGGFGGLAHHTGLITLGLALGCILLANKKEVV